LNPGRELAGIQVASLNKNFGVDRLDEEEMRDGTLSHIYGAFAMRYEGRVGRFKGESFGRFRTDKIEGKFWHIVVRGEKTAGDEALGLKTMKTVPDVARGTLGEKRLHLFSG